MKECNSVNNYNMPLLSNPITHLKQPFPLLYSSLLCIWFVPCISYLPLIKLTTWFQCLYSMFLTFTCRSVLTDYTVVMLLSPYICYCIVLPVCMLIFYYALKSCMYTVYNYIETLQAPNPSTVDLSDKHAPLDVPLKIF